MVSSPVEVTVEKVGPCEAKVRFTVPSSEIEAEFRKGLKAASKQVRMKGFRPGKVPPAVVEKMAGDAVRRETVERFLQDAYRKAVEDESLTPAAHPRVSPEDLAVEKGQDLSHEFRLSLKPEFELGTYRGLEISSSVADVTDEDVANAIEGLRDQHAVPKPLEGDAVPGPEGMAVGRIEFVHGEEQVAEREGLRLSPSQPPRGIDGEAWREAVSKATAGSQFELPLEFADDYPKLELRGQAGVARVRVDEVFELERPKDEELFQAFSVEDRAGLEEKFREELTAQRERAEQERVETELLQRVIGEHQMPLPEPMLEAQIEARRSQAREQLVSSGVPEAEADSQIAAEEASTREAAESSLRALFLVERIGEAEGLQVSRDDLIAELRQIALRNRASFDEVRQYYEEHGLFQQLSVELLERKVRTLLRENARIASA